MTTTQENAPTKSLRGRTGPTAGSMDSAHADPINSVTLRGRVSSAPTLRELPSGDALVTFRMTVPRPPDGRAGARRQSDWFDCAIWGGRILRTSQAWEVGDGVEITGELRRRHYRTGEGSQTRVEVVVRTGRRVRRAAAT